MEISEIIRRWQAGHSQRRIASGRGLSRDTVARYITAAVALGVSREGTELSEGQLSQLAAMGSQDPGRWRRPARSCWIHGPTRSTGGSPATGCR